MIQTVDLHELTLYEAKVRLDDFMDSLNYGVSEVVVIHGYHKGTTLKTFVSRYNHPRIKKKLKTMNKGQTIFLINN